MVPQLCVVLDRNEMAVVQFRKAEPCVAYKVKMHPNDTAECDAMCLGLQQRPCASSLANVRACVCAKFPKMRVGGGGGGDTQTHPKTDGLRRATQKANMKCRERKFVTNL